MTKKTNAQNNNAILESFRRMTAAKAVPKTWLDRLTINLKGGVWVGLFTFFILAACVYAQFLNGPDIKEGVRWTYIGVLTAFAGTKVAGRVMNSKNGVPVEED